MPDSQTLGLVVAAMVAGIICFRLYTVLGRRTGHEPSPQPAPIARPASLPQPAQSSGPASSGLPDIQLADRNFDAPKFLAGAREAYSRIVIAFIQGKREELRPLLSPALVVLAVYAVCRRFRLTGRLSLAAGMIAMELRGKRAALRVRQLRRRLEGTDL